MTRHQPSEGADSGREYMVKMRERWGDNRIQNTGQRYTREHWYNWQQQNLLAPGTG